MDENQGYLDLKVPVYFFMGQYGYDAPVTLFEENYTLMRSGKVYVKFEQSAHFPFFEEPEKFRSAIVQVKQDTVQSSHCRALVRNVG